MCWEAQGDIVFSDNIFTKEYQDRMYFRRDFNLSPYQGAIVTIAHELGHVLSNARPGVVAAYGDFFASRPVNTSAEENMVNVIALYLITGGAAWPDSSNNSLWLFPSVYQQVWRFRP